MGFAHEAKKKHLPSKTVRDLGTCKNLWMSSIMLQSLGQHGHSHGRNGLSPGTDPTATAVVPRARDALIGTLKSCSHGILQSDDATEHDGSTWPTTGTLACDMAIKHGRPVTRRHHLRAWSRDGYLEACDKAVFCPSPRHLECLPYEAVSPLSLLILIKACGSRSSVEQASRPCAKLLTRLA